MSALDRCRTRLTCALHAHHPASPKPIEYRDVALLRSGLRRSLRRRDADYVFASAFTLLECDPPKFWKEIAVIAVKDFGLADLVLVGNVIAAASSKTWRNKSGGDWHIASYLLFQLLKTPCDRRLQKLLLAARTDNSQCQTKFRPVIAEAADIINACERRVSYPTVNSICASECDAALKEAGERYGLDDDLIEICMQARRTTQTALPVLLPLALTAARSMGGLQTIIERRLPEVRTIGGLPSYVFDRSTYLGHMALRRLVREDRTIQDLLSLAPSIRQQSTILGETLFAVEGGIRAREISDHFSRELLLFNTNTSDSEHDQLVDEMRIAMRTAIPKLNDIREKLHASNPG